MSHRRRKCWLALASCLVFACIAAAPAGAESLYNGITTPTPWPPMSTSPSMPHCWPNEVLPYYLTTPPSVIKIDYGRQLFVDEFLINPTGTTLKAVHHLPVYEPNAIFGPDGGSLEGASAMPFSDGIWWDPNVRLFKMWYAGERPNLWGGSCQWLYATSQDGISWTRTTTNHPMYPGTNIVATNNGYPNPSNPRDSASIWLDLNPAQSSQRFRMLYHSRGLHNAFSADGIVFYTSISGDTGAWDFSGHPDGQTNGDRSTMFYNPFRNKWVYSIRGNFNIDANVPDTERLRFYYENNDWSVKMPSDPNAAGLWWWSGDRKDDPDRYNWQPSIYNLDCAPYESVMLGLFSMWHGDCHLDALNGDPEAQADEAQDRPKLNAVKLGYSRDGWYWRRPDRRKWLDYSATPGAWNYGNVQSAGNGPLIMGDTLYFYCSGRDYQNIAAGAGEAECLGLAYLRRDGYTSMDPNIPGGTGDVITRTVKFGSQIANQKYLFVNVNCPNGELKVEVQDPNGVPYANYTLANCNIVKTDSTIYRVTWTTAADLTSLVNTNVRFRFQITNGSLYAFWVSDSTDGRSNGYMAAGGPGYSPVSGKSAFYDNVGVAAYRAAYALNQVNAGSDRNVALPATASLDGTVTTTGQPGGRTWTYAWDKTSGPGVVTFGNPAAVDTTATFAAAGTYILRLTIDDGWIEAWDEMNVTATQAGSQWHVKTTGSPSGTGSEANPWDLQTALLAPAAVQPGDTIWVHAGEYEQTPLYCKLIGTLASPIKVRGALGEAMPVIRHEISMEYVSSSWNYNTHYTWLWGLAMAGRGEPNQTSNGIQISTTGDANCTVNGAKLINCVIHDNVDGGVGAWAYAIDLEINGCLVYYNGYDGPPGDRGHGHGLYIQSADDKLIKDNIIFRNFDKGVQLGGTSTAPRNYVTFEGNTLFNNSEISLRQQENFQLNAFHLQGDLIAQEPKLLNNMTYCYTTWYTDILSNTIENSNNGQVNGNYFISGNPAEMAFGTTIYGQERNPGLVMNNNTFRGTLNGFTLNEYGTGNVQLASEPNVPVIFVRPSPYELGRANITVYNWPQNSTVQADVSSLGLPTGTNYVVRDAQNFFASPIATGTYNGSPITIPMTGLTVAAPQGLPGYSTPPHTAPKFGCFVFLADTSGVNFGPSVNAGNDASITLPTNTTNLDGTVSDDGLPSGNLTQTWSKLSGAGTVTFANYLAVDTAATFSTSGTYVLRLTASDTALTAYDEVSITVNPAGANQPPSVGAGTDASITLPTNTASLDGTVTDDGLPGGGLTQTWTKQSGAGTVTFANYLAVDTTATFSTNGTYVLRLTASDTALTAYDEKSVTVNPPANAAPSVGAGVDQIKTLPINTASLDGTVTDDGQPNPPGATTVSWTKQSGAGTVTFASSTSVDTTATFSTSGTYALRLTANDSALTAYDEMNVTVLAAGSDILMKLLMDESSGTIASDSSGNNHPGTLVNGPTWVAGKSGNAVHFDETNDRMLVADFNFGPQFSLTFWFKLDDNTGSVTQQILDYSSGSSNGLGVWITEASASPPNRMYTHIRDGNDSNSATLDFALTVDPNWHLYVLTVQTGVGSKVYLDGVLKMSDTEGGDAINPASANMFWCTRYDYSSSRFFGGSLDDVRMYNRYLTQSDIDSLMGAPPSNVAPTVGAGVDQVKTWPTNTASLDGTVTDDGLPNPPAALTYTWAKQSGAGTVTFANSSAVDTTATFSTTGTYVLRLTASDSALSAYDEMNVSVNTATNVAPTVGAGVDQVKYWPTNTASLDGTVTDDGLPNPPAACTYSWTKTSGTGTVTFASSTSVDTTATFSTSGTYVLRLTANDSALTAYDEKSVTVNPATNQAPTADAGTAGQQIIWPTSTVNLDGTVSDDGLPNPPGATTVTWTKQSGAGTVTFASSTSVDTTATFSTVGTYVLRLTANDSALTAYDETAVTVIAEGSDIMMKLLMNEGTGSTAYDSSGNGRNGTLVNGPTWVAGQEGNAVHFDESNDRIDISDFVYGPELTLSFWFKLDDNTGTQQQSFFAHAAEAGPNSLNVLVYEASRSTNPNKVNTQLRDNTDSSATAIMFDLPQDWQWHLYTLTVETGVGCKVYLDANQVGADPDRGGDYLACNGTIRLATRPDAGAYWMGGCLDDVRMYNRPLSQPEIEALMGGEPSNQAPTVNAGTDQAKTWPTNTATLDGTVSDDGLPNPPAACTYSWTKQSGAGTVTFASSTSVDTTATFSTIGTYVLRLTANDSALTAYDEMAVTVSAANQAPTVSAGTDQVKTWPTNTATLDGTVSDDGLPSPPAATTASWTKESGAGTVSFASSTAVDTTATFSTVGTYVLRLTANDSALSAFDEVAITVNPPSNNPADFNGDGVVTGADFVIWQAHYPTASGATKADGDANGDGAVTGADFVIWQSNYQP